MSTPPCKICFNSTERITDPRIDAAYYSCAFCDFIFIDDKDLLSPEDEERRYRQHDNSPDNAGYVKMMESFIRECVAPYVARGRNVLDFGCGQNPVLASLLRNEGMNVDIYDRFFAPDEVYRGSTYDLITATEVLEHLQNPLETFGLFIEHLEENGIIAVMTHFHPCDEKQFIDWWYRRDKTHIGFYSIKTMEYLAKTFHMKLIQCSRVNSCIFIKQSSRL